MGLSYNLQMATRDSGESVPPSRDLIHDLRASLLAWYDANRRNLPWRQTRDPYAIWISEIMLQQTRVATVIERFQEFLRNFPTVLSLANASEQDVLALWSGLGYYRRARMLHEAAKVVAREHRGIMPRTAVSLRGLPGIGAYTSAAVASIAFGEKVAVVDGNVERVIQRLAGWGSESRKGQSELAREINLRAGVLLDPMRPGDFNQAMMELGATLCLPRTPGCGACPVSKFCAARASGCERELPVKLKKGQARNVALELAILEQEGSIFLIKRSALERRLADFWELPARNLFPRVKGAKLAEFRHRIVNDSFRVTVWHITDRNFQPSNLLAGNWVELAELDRIPLTTVTRKALAARLS